MYTRQRVYSIFEIALIWSRKRKIIWGLALKRETLPEVCSFFEGRESERVFLKIVWLDPLRNTEIFSLFNESLKPTARLFFSSFC